MSSFRRPLQVQLPPVYEIHKGQKRILADGEIITIQASVQPPQVYDYDTVKADLGGARIDRVILVTTGVEPRLPSYDEELETLPCYFLWQGRKYKNMKVREGLAGVIPHMQYYGVQEVQEDDSNQ